MRATSSRSSTGLVSMSSAPCSSAFTRLSTPCSAVMTTTGTSRVASRSRRARHTAKPSMIGIITSSSTRSGGVARAFSRASAPFPAVTVW